MSYKSLSVINQLYALYKPVKSSEFSCVQRTRRFRTLSGRALQEDQV